MLIMRCKLVVAPSTKHHHVLVALVYNAHGKAELGSDGVFMSAENSVHSAGQLSGLLADCGRQQLSWKTTHITC